MDCFEVGVCQGVTKAVLRVKSDHVLAGTNQPPIIHTSNIKNNNYHERFVTQDVHDEEDDNDIMQKISNDLSSSSVLLRQEQQKIPDTMSLWDNNKSTHCWGWNWCECSQCVPRSCFSFCVIM